MLGRRDDADQRGLKRSNFYAGFWLNVAVGAVGLWSAVLVVVPLKSPTGTPRRTHRLRCRRHRGQAPFRVAAIEKVGASVSSAILNLVPLISTVLAIALLGERITAAILSGTLVVVLGTILLSVSGRHVGFRPGTSSTRSCRRCASAWSRSCASSASVWPVRSSTRPSTSPPR